MTWVTFVNREGAGIGHPPILTTESDVAKVAERVGRAHDPATRHKGHSRTTMTILTRHMVLGI